MSTSTLTLEAPAQAPVLPDLDESVGIALADEMLLGAAKEYAPAKVKAGQARSTSRAWSMGGSVD